MADERNDHDEYERLELELKRLLKRIEVEPVPDELQALVRKLEAALTNRSSDPG